VASDLYCLALAVQADGNILVGGDLQYLNGTFRPGCGRLLATAPATQSLTSDASSITWLRGGTSPEVASTSFEYSSDGVSWTSVGGSRISGGWRVTGLNLPANPCLRARGYSAGGAGTPSSWFVETTMGQPFISVQPISQTNNAGDTAGFSALAGGSPSLVYRWRKGITPLAEGGSISGATSAALAIADVLGGDAGSYSLVVTNPLGNQRRRHAASH
jgi:hypothetical protein